MSRHWATRRNLANGSVQEQWYQFIHQGLNACLFAGLPCESWSVTRALGGIAGHTKGDGGPRTLRTAEHPMELDSNVLLTFTIKAMLLMAQMCRLAVIEHPDSEPIRMCSNTPSTKGSLEEQVRNRQHSS